MPTESDPPAGWRLAIHGGAGLIARSSLTPADEAAAREGLNDALTAGSAVLQTGGTALDAVQAAIVVLENCPVFNAAHGAVLAEHGHVELDAAVMDGQRRFGAVSGVRTTLNPIALAREVLQDGLHVFLAGPGADAFARSRGLPQVAPKAFIVPARTDQLARVKQHGGVFLDHDDAAGTVGAVARDSHGGLAAGNSTGGMVNKRAGRVGDAPVCGAGTYADDRTCAVAATGHGEPFIRAVVAHRISNLIELAGLSLEQACARALDDVDRLGGTGGVVAVGRDGRVCMPFNSGGMYRGMANAHARRVAIW